MTKGLSKSRYTAFCQCPKNLWLKIYKPEETTEDPGVEARFEQGNEVGDLAKGLFGPYKEVTTKDANGNLDLNKMCALTKQYMDENVDVICEASFSLEKNHLLENLTLDPNKPLGKRWHESHYCAVDILRRNGDGWDIYEVKSSSFTECACEKKKLEKYAPDIAYQKWILTQCGIKVANTCLVCLNSSYIRHGELDIKKLFAIIDMHDLVENEYLKVPSQSRQALNILGMKDEPDYDLSEHCKKPYTCAFLDYCKRRHGVPEDEPTVFDLYRMNFSKMLERYNAGRITFDALRTEKLNDKQHQQVECTLRNTEHINPDGIRKFLNTLSYPLYFLDFETMQYAIPQWDDTKPYQQITFQYSLHIKEKPDSIKESLHDGRTLRMKVGKRPVHKEYLAQSDDTDPRRKLAERLCEDIPMNVCVLAYNKMFECGRIRELAEMYPDLREHLLNIADHIVDLIDPFRAGYYYVPAMGGSFSIKSVLPALFPNDPDLNYHNLTGGVQNGGDAMTIFPKIQHMHPDEAKAAREALLRYCELDTFAMVKVWEKLKEKAGMI